jgi:hypothetical protein
MHPRRLPWALSAVGFLLPLSSLWGTADFSTAIRIWPWIWLVLAAASPGLGLGLLALTGPLAVVVLSWLGPAPFGGHEMLELQVLPVLAGISLRWAWRGAPPAGRLAHPALVLGALVVASGVVGVSIEPLVIGAGDAWPSVIWEHLTRHYFSDPRALPAWHGAAVWIEAVCLAMVAERYLLAHTQSGPRLSMLAAAGLAVEASWSLVRLAQIADRSPDVTAALWRHATSTRISPHFPDVNAIGSLLALAAVASVVWLISPRVHTVHRVVAAVGAALTGSALWLSQSRAALVSAAVLTAIAWVVLQRPSRRVVLGTIAAAVIVAAGAAAMDLDRVSRAPASTALVIRIEMAKAGGRMVADHPVLGVGLGRFREASPAYIPQSLHAIFPVVAAGGENAHNQLVQVAGELGLTGLVAFMWFWWAVLGPALRSGRASHPASWVAAWTAGLLAFLLSAMMGHPFLTPFVTVLTFLIAGVLAGQVPASAPVTTRRGSWIVLVACLAVAITLPLRVMAARRAADLDNVVIGASRVAGERDGVRYRLVEPHSTWFVRTTARSIEIPMRSETTAGCTVNVSVDRRPADVAAVTNERWTSVRFTFREPETRWNSRRIDLHTSSADCRLLVGRLQVTD